MDCIEMVEDGTSWNPQRAARARNAYRQRIARQERTAERVNAERTHSAQTKQAVMADVMARVRALAASK